MLNGQTELTNCFLYALYYVSSSLTMQQVKPLEPQGLQEKRSSVPSVPFKNNFRKNYRRL